LVCFITPEGFTTMVTKKAWRR